MLMAILFTILNNPLNIFASVAAVWPCAKLPQSTGRRSSFWVYFSRRFLPKITKQIQAPGGNPYRLALFYNLRNSYLGAETLRKKK